MRFAAGADDMTEGTHGRKARARMPFGLKSAALALLLAVPPLLSTASLARGPESVAGIAEELQNTVVNISTTQTLKGSSEKTAPPGPGPKGSPFRSEEHTSELQSRSDLVCRLLLEKKKKN